MQTWHAQGVPTTPGDAGGETTPTTPTPSGGAPTGDGRDRWAAEVVLRNGDTALIRPITPDDRDALRAFHERQSLESKYRRFFSAKPTLSESELTHFTEVDFVDRVALVVEYQGRFMAWSSYERWPNRPDADAAFMVDDTLQGTGVATLMLEHLAAIARTNGIERFTAEVLADNRPMMAVFAKAGWPLQRRFDSGVIDLDFDLENTAEFIDSVERREQRADSQAIARLLMPRSIAVIGASDTPGTPGAALWANISSGFSGACHPVNPNRDMIGDQRCFASVTEIGSVAGEDVAVAVIAVPHRHLRSVIDQCIEARVRGAVVVTAVDGSGIDMGELVHHCRRNGLRLIGPASFGIASPRPESAIQAALVDIALPAGGVAISMQSGTLASSLLALAASLELGLSWFVSLGDKCDVSANDLLQFWDDDEATRVIGLYTESLGNPRKFARLARRVSMRRPIVAVRTGSAIIGPGAGALYEQSGVIEVPSVRDLLDTVRVLDTQPLMNGDRVALITNARSPGVLATAALGASGLSVVEPPIQLDWSATDLDFESAVTAAVADDGNDAVLVIHAPPDAAAVTGPTEMIDRAATGADRPVIAVMLGALDGPLRPGSTIPRFSFPEAAAEVLGRLHAYSQWRRTEGAAEVDEPVGIDRRGVAELLDTALEARDGEDRDPRHLDPAQIRSILERYGIAMARCAVVAPTDAVAAAETIGYPVAVKATHDRRGGPSVQAGVALDLTDADDVAAAIETMTNHLGRGALEMVMVQEMAEPGVNLRIRSQLDAVMGPVVSVGLGGQLADAIGDSASRLAPISGAAATAMLAATRAGAALDDETEHRATEVVVRVAQLVSDHPEIIDVDLNPVIAGATGVTVVDASVQISPAAHTEHPLRRL